MERYSLKDLEVFFGFQRATDLRDAKKSLRNLECALELNEVATIPHDLYKNKYDMDRFLEPGQFLLAYNSRRLWAYFDAFEGASNDMKASY